MDVTTMICPKCRSEMEEGFVPDYTYGSIKRSYWAKGLPKKSFWTGLTEPTRLIPIVMFRCMRCGYPESYAWRNATSPGS